MDLVSSCSDEELRNNVGQLFIVGFNGYIPNEDIKSLITSYRVGAIILFQRNVSNPSQLIDLINSLQEIARSAGYAQDLLIAIDQENGLVTRIKAPIATQLPGSMALGATGDASNAFKIASATAETLKGFGINMNYAPVADINSEPKNPVIGVRSPSDDPEIVGRFVSAQIKGLSKGGVVPCIKHFPGHGDTAVDSHYGLPVITKSKAMLDRCELVPFKRAVAERVDAIMTAHISMPGLAVSDETTLQVLPASLNPDVIDILRSEMRYEGLIISDCLEMDAVRSTYGTEKGAVMALKAGSDCVMICHTMSSQVSAIERVINAVKSGEISQESIQTSVNRVKDLKARYLATSTNVVVNPTLVTLEATNIRQETLASEIYAKSTTVVRSKPGALPLSTSSESKIVLLCPEMGPLSSGVVESGVEKEGEPYRPSTFRDLLHSRNSSVVEIKYSDSSPLSPHSAQLIANAHAVILVTENANLNSYQKELGLSLGKNLGQKLIAIAICDPYDFLQEKEEVQNYITIYEPTIPAFKSAVNVIFGITQAQGILPVCSPITPHEIRLFQGSDADVAFIWKLWHKLFPNWGIDSERLGNLLRHSSGHHVLHENGFCLAYIAEEGHGKIACIGVCPEHQGKGIGTALITKAREELNTAAETAGFEGLKSLGIGSSFPRFWSGVPIEFPSADKEFFLRRGFRKSNMPTIRDLYRDITAEVAPANVLERVSKVPVTFAPWSPELYEECMMKQRANFSGNMPWVKAYERLAAANQHHEVMVALSATGEQVGWTLMCSPSSLFCLDFAFLPLMPSKNKTGIIACVGVDKSARGGGIGLALLVKAMENMKARGIEGVYIDSVVIRGFYETLGYVPVWDFEQYNW